MGALEEAGVRMVDHPLAVARSEIKQLQLAVARRLGIAVPATQVTNDPDTARAFAANRKIIAKAVSPGVGIAPYVAEVLDCELDALKTLPTMLQELVSASADLRVVVVGDESWAWRRHREAGTVDWRQVDPGGSRFAPITNEELSASACEIAAALGLSMSVQDWLETDSGLIFLESNAHGAWLFLSGSQGLVAPAIARHLSARHGG
jgi:glutathione synthase/RimK-type ligase-like ATP-grasp enzyme